MGAQQSRSNATPRGTTSPFSYVQAPNAPRQQQQQQQQQQQRSHTQPTPPPPQQQPQRPQQQQQHQQAPAAPPAPPASQRAIRQIPTVTISRDELQDEANRECCVCLEEHEIGGVGCKMPCGHLFHKDCLMGWLGRHCTCPVCRYEVETDDSTFEAGRKERMRQHRPRLRIRELEVKSVAQLKEMMANLNIHPPNTFEKQDLIQAIASSGRVDIIPSAPPVECSLEQLRATRIGDLLFKMKELGIVVDRNEIIEKEDLVQALVNSGRIILVEPESFSEADLLNLSIRELKTIAKNNGIDIRSCVEKGDIVDCLLSSGVIRVIR